MLAADQEGQACSDAESPSADSSSDAELPSPLPQDSNRPGYSQSVITTTDTGSNADNDTALQPQRTKKAAETVWTSARVQANPGTHCVPL